MAPGNYVEGITVDWDETTQAAYTSADILDEIAAFSLDANQNAALKKGTYVNWIDRIDVPEFALDFYKLLEEATDGDGKGDYLIEDRYFGGTLSGAEEDGEFSSKNGLSCIIVGSQKCNSISEKDQVMQEMRAYTFAVLAAFDRDHPEVFWLGNEHSVLSSYAYDNTGAGTLVVSLLIHKTAGNDDSSGFDIRSSAYLSQDTIERDVRLRDERVRAITEKCSGNLSASKKVAVFNDRLTKSNEYNTSNLEELEKSGKYPQAWECISALDGRDGEEGPVCEAYSRAFKVLCDEVGIPCVLVDGFGVSLKGAEAHMWNYTKVGPAWYAVDVTWNDPVGAGSGKESGAENEDFLLVGSESAIYGIPFDSSHQMQNTVFPGGTAFVNGPALNKVKYDPADEANCAAGKHQFADYVYNNNATCVKDGTEAAQCLYCDKIDTRTKAGSSKGASHSYGAWVTTKAATCTAAGAQKRTCSRSSAHVETRSVAALGHNFGAWRSNGDAQVNVNGTETARCTRCTVSKTRVAAGSALAPKVGQTVVIGAASYKATGAATVTYAGPANKKAASATVPATVTISGRAYKVTAIAPKAFAGNKYLKSVKIGANVKTVPASAFKGCTRLTSVSFGNGITSLGKNAFYGCKALKSVTLGTKVTTIGDGAFQNCAKLTKVTVKSTKLSKVGKNAFAGCKKLGTITLKTTKLKSVGKNAFKGTKSKMTVKVPKKKLKAYQKLCKNKGSKTVRVKK